MEKQVSINPAHFSAYSWQEDCSAGLRVPQAAEQVGKESDLCSSLFNHQCEVLLTFSFIIWEGVELEKLMFIKAALWRNYEAKTEEYVFLMHLQLSNVNSLPQLKQINGICACSLITVNSLSWVLKWKCTPSWSHQIRFVPSLGIKSTHTL